MTEAQRLAEVAKKLAEDMADKACATEAGEFVAKERAALYEAIDRLAALSQPSEDVVRAREESLRDSLRLDWCERHSVGIELLSPGGNKSWEVFGDDNGAGSTLRSAIDNAARFK